MQISVTFKKIDPSDTLKMYVDDKMNRLDKYLDNPAEANVVLSVEKFRHIAEVTVAGDGFKVKGTEETDNMYSAIDMVMDKLEKQVKKNKERFKKRRAAARAGSKRDKLNALDKAGLSELNEAKVIKAEQIEVLPMDIEEAIMQMELINNSFLVFRNARTEKVNVLYRRKDDNYGLIEATT
ncbi:MAG: ribosome-associated translation inhibitor RaiA [Pseudomonadota bacterium]